MLFRSYFNLNNVCLSKSDVLSGEIGQVKIEYKFPIYELGIWKVFVFVFDEEYNTRPNVHLATENNYPGEEIDFDHAIAYGYNEIMVSNTLETQPTSIEKFSKNISNVIKFLLALLSFFTLSSNKIYPYAERIYKNEEFRNELQRLIIMLIITTLWILLLLKIS